MKNLKKLASLLLALILTLSMTVSVAEEPQAEQEGSITINGVTEDGKYELYKLLNDRMVCCNPCYLFAVYVIGPAIANVNNVSGIRNNERCNKCCTHSA